MIAVQRAQREDFQEIEQLLAIATLPVDGVRDHPAHYFVVREEGMMSGAVGLEHYGDDGLLRSLVVHPAHRSRGIGEALFREVLSEAHRLGIKRLVLLTTTAESYFAARGFRSIDRKTITGALAGSDEFRSACPASAVCMERNL